MCVLHNFIRTTEDGQYTPLGLCDGVQPGGRFGKDFGLPANWGTRGINGHASWSSTIRANEIQNQLTEFFSSDCDNVPWQPDHV